MATSYLSPGVYVEETDTGNKPIEGVSTSTAGVVGVTERGPANVPTLITSFGDFRRIFGGYLSIGDFTDATGRAHCYLPHAVEGLFVNGGKRVYVTRVTADGALRAERRVFFDDPLLTNPAATTLVLPAEESTGTAFNLPRLYVLDTTGLAVGDTIRIGDGSRAEYRRITGTPAANDVVLGQPFQRSHATGGAVHSIPRTALAGVGTFSLPKPLTAGATGFAVTSATAADITALVGMTNVVLEIGPAAGDAEYVLMTSATQVDANNAQVALANPLQAPHRATLTPADTEKMTVIDVSAAGTVHNLALPANGGAAVIILDNAAGFTAGNLAIVDAGTFPTQEVRRITALETLTPALPPYEEYPIGSAVEHVSTGDDIRNVTAGPSKSKATLDDVTLLEPGMQLLFPALAGTPPNVGTIQSISGSDVTLVSDLGALPSGTAVVQPRILTAATPAGSMTLQLDARIGLGLDPDNADVLRVGVAPNYELVQVAQLSEPRALAPDSGAVVLERPLQRSYPAGTPVQRQKISVDVTKAAGLIVFDAAPTATQLVVSAAGFAAGDIVRVTTPTGAHLYHVIDSVATPATTAVELDTALIRSHAAGATIAKREQLFLVRALDTGDWGNRALVSSADEESGLCPRAEVVSATASPGPTIPSTMHLNTVTGVEPGTVLELRSNDGTTQIGDFVKVRSVDRSAGNLVILDAPGLSAAQVAAVAGAGPNPILVRSREFRMEVMLLKPPSPAVPIRNDELLDRELFRTLSMDPRHSHYFMRIIGATFTDGADLDDLGLPLRRSDRRSEGGSQYVRVFDLGTSPADMERVRLGPEILFDVMPSGLTRPARLRIGQGESAAQRGTDNVLAMGDGMYTGGDDREPAKRTGIYALKNALDVSLIAAPGQVTPAVQQALIDQCEDLRYRFAVLDAHGPADDTIDDITAQRQQFDTKYAAFYHPWLTIPDPFPTNIAAIAQFPIPPSGHMLGIYARVDEQRGVHKAPANEVVGGMTGLTRYLNQAEQDVLNAYPTNIDVIRDFRINNRGIRVWGARVITSDSDWKYVNVRRLMIFIEDSLDRGLQWVVFEPNDEKLWARVRRSVSNFLTTVWRNGALEGTTKDQAFYVKCDRTTMTQDDIDNGRLICVVGVAPVKPAEFVIIRIGLWTADASS